MWLNGLKTRSIFSILAQQWKIAFLQLRLLFLKGGGVELRTKENYIIFFSYQGKDKQFADFYIICLKNRAQN